MRQIEKLRQRIKKYVEVQKSPERETAIIARLLLHMQGCLSLMKSLLIFRKGNMTNLLKQKIMRLTKL